MDPTAPSLPDCTEHSEAVLARLGPPEPAYYDDQLLWYPSREWQEWENFNDLALYKEPGIIIQLIAEHLNLDLET